MFTPGQARYLLNLVLKEPVTSNVGDVVKGLRISPDVTAIIIALQGIIKPTQTKPVMPEPAAKAKKPKNVKANKESARPGAANADPASEVRPSEPKA